VTHEDRRGAYRVLLSEIQRKKQFRRPGDNGNNIIKHLKENRMTVTSLI